MTPAAQSPSTAFTPFANSVYDTEGLLKLLEDLDLITRSLYRNKEGTISAKAHEFTTSNIIRIFEDLEAAGLEPQGDQKQAKFLKDLTAYLKQMPVVKVTLAFEPTTGYLIKLNSQISEVVVSKVILEVDINQYVVGGANFEYKGKTSKQTLDVVLEEALAKQV